MISETDKAYAAGLFDGEGCVFIQPPSKTVSFGLRVSVKMTGETVQKRLQHLFGGSLYHKPGKGNHRPQLCWTVTGHSAISFLKAVLPYADVKREEVEEALKYEDTISICGRHITKEARKKREDIYHRLRELKGRGYVRPDAISLTAIREVK